MTTSIEESPPRTQPGRFRTPAEAVVTVLSLLLLLYLTHAYFVEAPYAGFLYEEGTGRVRRVYEPEAGDLQVDDHLLRVRGVPWERMVNDRRYVPFAKIPPGQQVLLEVQRGEQQVAVAWEMTGPTDVGIAYRLNSQWWLPYVFWLAGVLALLLIRPRGRRHLVFVAFNFLTAFWLAAGTVSQWHVANSLLIFRVAIWLSLPVYLHLHWVFPEPLFPVSKKRGRLIIGAGYLLILVPIAAEVAGLLPDSTYLIPFGLAVGGSMLLLVWRLILRPAQRAQLGWLAVGPLLILLPILIFSIAPLLGVPLSSHVAGGSLLALPALPIAYFYVLYQNQLGARRKRVRRLFDLYLVALVLGSLLIVLLGSAVALGGANDVPLFVESSALLVLAVSLSMGFIPLFALAALADVPPDVTAGPLLLRPNRLLTPLLLLLLGTPLVFLPALLLASNGASFLVLMIVTAGLTGVWTSVAYRPLERLVDRYLLNIEIPSDHLLEEYAARITTSLDRQNLVEVLTGKVLPSLLVRESALLYLPSPETVTAIYNGNIAEEHLPPAAEVHALAKQESALHYPFPGAILAFPLQLGERPLGLWCLGRRDPDDWYSPAELPVFKALADQTTVALSHIIQSENLQALYRANIDRHETERTGLARDLHDEVLSRLAALTLYADGKTAPQFQEAYQAVVDSVRQTISGLRPAMLNFGLAAALEEMVDDFQEQYRGRIHFRLDVAASDDRYPARAEPHLYRIMQQAVENAVEHAQPQMITIAGRLEPAEVHLSVTDDGIGLDSSQLDLSSLLAHKHFGLVGIYERAALIGAHVYLSSVPGQETTLGLTWKVADLPEPEEG